MVVIIILAVVVVLMALFLLGMCKVASDADDASDAIHDSLHPEPPAPHIAQPRRLHPSVRRAIGNRAAEDTQ